MIWCLTRKVLYLICYKIWHTLWFGVLQERFVYLICYKILHTLWFGVLQERFCIWFVIRYDTLWFYKKGFYLICYKIWHTLRYLHIWFVIRLHVMICLTRKVLYLICYKILFVIYVMIWCLTRKVLYLICYKILHTLWFDVLQERLCIWFVIRYYIRYDLVSYKKGFVSDLL